MIQENVIKMLKIDNQEDVLREVTDVKQKQNIF